MSRLASWHYQECGRGCVTRVIESTAMSVGDPTTAAMGRPDCLEPEDAPRGSAARLSGTLRVPGAQHFTIPAIAAKAQQYSSAARGKAAAAT